MLHRGESVNTPDSVWRPREVMHCSLVGSITV